MKRPITICTGQFGDLKTEDLFRTVHEIGYDGLEVATQSHIDVQRVVSDPAYVKEYRALLDKYHLSIGAISGHLAGQCVGDRYDPRLDNFVPAKVKGNPEAIVAWATEQMKPSPKRRRFWALRWSPAFLGSPIWAFWYSFPQTTEAMVEQGYQLIKERWSPIFDVYDQCDVKLALEVHPTEIAFDYYSTQRLLEVLEYRPTLGIELRPQPPAMAGREPRRIPARFCQADVYHVHLKDVRINCDDRAGVLGSHIEFGDTRRGWNFVSLGHGDVDFEAIIRELNQMNYQGPLAVEWEDSGMERTHGATEALAFARRMNFQPSDFSFDAALKMD